MHSSVYLLLSHICVCLLACAQVPVDADTKRRIADGLESTAATAADPLLFAAACARCELDIGGDSLRRFRESAMLAHALTAHAMSKPSTNALMPSELSWHNTQPQSQQQRPQQQPPHLMPQPKRASSWWLACMCADDGRDGNSDTRTAPLVLSPRVAFG